MPTVAVTLAERRRVVNAGGALACALMFGYALYSQHVLGLEPCPLCMFQRVGIGALGASFALAALHHPRGFGAKGYAALIALVSLATAGVAIRHLYIQSQPPGSVPSCGAPLDALLHMFPLTQVIVQVLRGGGECAKVDWTFLGLAMPAWVLIAAVLLGTAGLLANAATVRRDR
jgi:protein dithiol:quinone oxidoreductase